MDLTRILLAMLVMLSHAPELTDGNRSRELLSRLTHTGLSFGTLGVRGFFLLSGYLITKSWLGDSVLPNYLRKRLLRIVPGYAVAAILSTLIVGWLAPGVPQFFHHFTLKFPFSLLILSSPETPPVLPGQSNALVDGALYTIGYEFLCYLLIPAAAFCGLLRRRGWLLGLTAVMLFVAFAPAFEHYFPFKPHFIIYRVTILAPFFVGACFYLFRDVIQFRRWIALIAALLLVAASFSPGTMDAAFIVFGGYLLFYLFSLKIDALAWMRHVPDISYGVYVYGWPVEILWIYFHHGSPWIAFAVSLLICLPLGWMSWHFIERPMLKLKRKPSVPLTI
jgi:peptidoglycan/LPS O-acetylase OafA/YrhL